MRVGIVAVGSELLTPFFQDTDSLYLSQRINDLGWEVDFKFIVGDEPDKMKTIIHLALNLTDILFIIGGLGPTEDDRTREVVAELTGRKLTFQPSLLGPIEERFRLRGLTMPASNQRQAFLLEGAEPLPNKTGTAPGQWLEIEGKRIILLPGPPKELQPMFEHYVWPRLLQWRRGFLARKVIKITGLTESQVQDLIQDLYPQDSSLKITLLAYPGQIEIHLTCSSPQEEVAQEKMEPLINAIKERLGPNIFSLEGEELEEVVGRLLREAGKTLAVAESCTGGLVGHRLTAVPGSSDYFLGSFVAYSNKVKSSSLGIPEELISESGAVSPEVAQAMAEAARERTGADYGLSATGIAGPTGGSPTKPVGLVYICLASCKHSEVSRHVFLGSRDQVKFQTSQRALDMLRRYLLKEKEEMK